MKSSEPLEAINPNDPKYFRDRVEGFMLGRLTNDNGHEVEVPNWLFEGIMSIIDPLVQHTASQRMVQGFTDDDLRSFMAMKVHQVLRRKQFDLRKPAGSFFKAVFRNMFNDLNKMKDNALKGDFSEDCLDLRDNFSDKMQQIFEEDSLESPMLEGLVANVDSETEAKEVLKMFFE